MIWRISPAPKSQDALQLAAFRKTSDGVKNFLIFQWHLNNEKAFNFLRNNLKNKMLEILYTVTPVSFVVVRTDLNITEKP